MQSFYSSVSLLFRWSGLTPLKQAVRQLQTLLNNADFQHLKQLVAQLPLAPLLRRQPRFVFKYLSPYIATNFDRTSRLTLLLHHYRFLQQHCGPAFFAAVAGHAILWRDERGPEVFTISISYPQQIGFEAELSLNFVLNDTVLQVVGFVIAPGHLLGTAEEPILLLSQVQGTRQAALLKHATRALHDIPPAILLVNAAYGLVAAWGIRRAAGVSSESQVSAGQGNYFNYTAFWQRLMGSSSGAGGTLLLPMPTPEKPITQIASHHRGRNLRKRRYKQGIRETVEQQARATFGLPPLAAGGLRSPEPLGGPKK